MPAFARAVVYPDNEEKLKKLLLLLHTQHIPYKVIGGMTNLLVRNGIYHGVIIKTDKLQTKSLAECKITLGCGVRIGAVIQQLASFGLGGMEGLTGIPGTVGGMIRQNAGAFGWEISDRFISARCYLPTEAKEVVFTKAEMSFSYRKSILSDNGAVIMSVELGLVEDEPEHIIRLINDLKDQRKKAQPTEYPSLGSVFKRYNGQSAGYYIDRAGLKGLSVGGAQVSRKHAGFIVNTGAATADNYLELIDKVKERVYAEFGIELEEEIEII